MLEVSASLFSDLGISSQYSIQSQILEQHQRNLEKTSFNRDFLTSVRGCDVNPRVFFNILANTNINFIPYTHLQEVSESIGSYLCAELQSLRGKKEV